MLITMIIMLITIMIILLISMPIAMIILLITIMIIMLLTVRIAVINMLITMLIPLQAALLYTDADRRRRIRVINRQMKVVDDLPPLAASVSRTYLGHISGSSRAHLGAISPRRSIRPPS